jgi:hypothetical protein
MNDVIFTLLSSLEHSPWMEIEREEATPGEGWFLQMEAAVLGAKRRGSDMAV